MDTLGRLIRFANRLDRSGLYNEAKMIDEVVKKTADTAAQLRDLNKKMSDTLIDAVVDKISSWRYGSHIKMIEKYRGKDYRKTYSAISKLVGAYPEHRGALNAGMAAVSPMMDQYVKLVQENKATKQQTAPVETGPGVAGTGPSKPTKRRLPRGPRVLAVQKAYNQVYDQLTKLQTLNMEAFPAKLIEDKTLGNKTRAALKTLPRMKKILSNELRKRRPTEQQPATPSPGATPSQLTPGQQKRMPATQKAFTAMDISNTATQLYRQMMRQDPGKGSKYPQEAIRKMLSNYVDYGMGLEKARQFVSGKLI